MTQFEAQTLEQQIAALSRRIVQLETLNARRRKRAQRVAPIASFLSIFMALSYAGIFITSHMLTNVSGDLSALLQSLMCTCLLASGLYGLIGLVAKVETAPQENQDAAAAKPLTAVQGS